MDTPLKKICSQCDKEKLLTEFNRFKHGKFGREARCRACAHLDNLARLTKRVEPLPEKTCIKCGETKPIKEFGTDKYTSDGKAARCKACKREDGAQSRVDKPEMHRAKTARWRKNHPDQVAAYTEAHKEQTSANRRARYAADPEKELTANRAWYEANKDDRKLSMAAWEAENIEKRKAQKLAAHLANPEARRIRGAAWLAKNPGYGAIKWQRRASRQAGAEVVDLSEEQWEEIKIAYNFRCVYCPPACKECKNKTHDLQQDHIEPVAHGGNYTVHNIVPACPFHNAQKGDGPVLNPVQPLLLTVAAAHVPKRKHKAS